MSKKEDKVQNALFATLDSSVSSLFLQNVGKNIFVSDTIGFIQDLPTQLVDAFKSTLMETINADILLHVVDGADPNRKIKIETVNLIIKDLGMTNKKQIYVFNKLDQMSDADKEMIEKEFKDTLYIFISAKNNLFIDSLILLIENELLSMGMKRASYLNYLDK
jgi:GTP-binding protein HflX